MTESLFEELGTFFSSTQKHVQDEEGGDPQLFMARPVLTFIYPGFDCGSPAFWVPRGSWLRLSTEDPTPKH